MMEKYITDERTGLKYELVGDYYLIAGDDEPEEERPIGVWGQRHLRYLKKHRRVRYANLLTSGELNAYTNCRPCDGKGKRENPVQSPQVRTEYNRICEAKSVGLRAENGSA